MLKVRRFELPRVQDLGKDQDDALALPKEGQHLIVGGPGTGKSVLALLRVKQHERKKDDYIFLVFNHLLHKASLDLVKEQISSTTWMRWFNSQFVEFAEKALPTLEPEPGKTWRPTDWDGVLNAIGQKDCQVDEIPLQVVIDEGQDMPPEFYMALANMGFVNFFVAADQNQQLDRRFNSSIQDIRNCLAIEPKEVVYLSFNYRNSYPVARLAQTFYTDKASERPELPEERKGVKTPLLFEYDNDRFASLARRILKTVDIRPNRLIGIICPNNKVREKYLGQLRESAGQMTLDHGVPEIQTYSSGSKTSVRFDIGGIMVINFQSCKGLEFDYVFLADINRYYCNPGLPDSMEQMKKNFYVMVARARDHVVLLKEKGEYCSVEEYILPDENSILAREM